MQLKAGGAGRGGLLAPRRGTRAWVQYDHRCLRIDRGSEGSLNPADPPALKLLHVTGGQTRPSGVSHSRTSAVKKKDTARVSLDGGVEELTQGGENDVQWTSLPNQSADHCT